MKTDKFTFVWFETFVRHVYDHKRIRIYWQNAAGETTSTVFLRSKWDGFSDEQLEMLFKNNPIYGAIAKVTLNGELIASTLVQFGWDESAKSWYCYDTSDVDMFLFIDDSLRNIRMITVEAQLHQDKPTTVAWQ